MKRVCFFNSMRIWGGGEKSHFEYAINFRDKKYVVFLVTGKNTPLYKKVKELDFPTLSIHITNFSLINPIKLYRLRNFFKKNNIDTVFLNSSADLKTGGIAAKWARIKYIVYMRGLAVPIKNSYLNRLLLTKVVSHVVANSEDTRKTIIQNLSPILNNDKVHVIYRGINFNEWDERPVSNLKLKTGNEIIIGNVGRLVEQKGQWMLIEIAKKLKSHGLKFKLYIAGEGSLEADLKQMVKRNNLEEYVYFPGFLNDVKSFLYAIDIFVFPSIWEGFGNAMVEAMAEKKPVIAFNKTSNPYIVLNESMGFLVDYPNLDQFADAILNLANDKTLRDKIGENARKSVIERFSMDNIIREWEELLP